MQEIADSQGLGDEASQECRGSSEGKAEPHTRPCGWGMGCPAHTPPGLPSRRLRGVHMFKRIETPPAQGTGLRSLPACLAPCTLRACCWHRVPCSVVKTEIGKHDNYIVHCWEKVHIANLLLASCSVVKNGTRACLPALRVTGWPRLRCQPLAEV